MLRLRRRPAKTHARLAKEELNEGIGHLMLAANHAAGGVGATVGPRMHAARERMTPAADRMRTVAVAGLGTTAATTLAPLAIAARQGSRLMRQREAMKIAKAESELRARKAKMSGRRLPKMLMLAAGATVGVAGAAVMRGRRSRRWEEYDASRPMESPAEQAEGVLARPSDTATMTTETLVEKASSAVDSATAGRTSSAGTPTPAPGMATPVPTVESPSSNSRS